MRSALRSVPTTSPPPRSMGSAMATPMLTPPMISIAGPPPQPPPALDGQRDGHADVDLADDLDRRLPALLPPAAVDEGVLVDRQGAGPDQEVVHRELEALPGELVVEAGPQVEQRPHVGL